MKILVTGCSGFIGFHLCRRLLKKNNFIIGLDNMNKYYDINLKKTRLNILKKNKKFIFSKIDIKNFNNLKIFVKKNKPQMIINLAAQAGVRYSFQNPRVYIDSNIKGFMNILDVAREIKCKNIIYASSSSVYGENKLIPFNESQITDLPKQIYSISKKTNEHMARVYAKYYKINCIGLRFFTVYGPYGRPDMALFKFVKNIFSNKRINLFNNGNHKRDFTYIDDVIDAIILIIDKLNNKESLSTAKSEIFNIARGKSEKLSDFLKIVEKNIGKKAKVNYLPMQNGDMKSTYGSIKKIKKKFGYNPKVSINKGIKKFIKWYMEFYEI